jgi:ketosteroid isomerase-like protein
MAAEDVDVVRRAYAALGRRPEPDLETVLRLYAADHVLVTEWGMGDSRRYRGLAGFRQAEADIAELFEDFRNEVEELFDVGEGVVVAIIRARGWGRRSEAPVDDRVGAVLRVVDGRIAQSHYYLTPKAAFEAAGASPSDCR